MGGRNPGRRTRALGTRGRVLSYLADGEISDPKGMASTVLAEAVGYPGSSAAFAQLLSGMERSGLIEREIRGKRTYRIIATAAGRGEGTAPRPRGAEAGAPRSRDAEADAPASRRGGAGVPVSGRGGNAPGPRHSAAPAPASRRGGAGAPESRRDGADVGRRRGMGVTAGRGDQEIPADDGRSGDLAAASQAPDFDYDELARRLLVQVVRRLAAPPEDVPPSGRDAGEPAEIPGGGPAGAGRAGSGPDAELQQTVAGLEQKLASVRSRQRKLTAENARLREQLQAAQESLARAEERASAAQVTGQLGGPELQLLERLLSGHRDQPGRPEEAGAG